MNSLDMRINRTDAKRLDAILNYLMLNDEMPENDIYGKVIEGMTQQEKPLYMKVLLGFEPKLLQHSGRHSGSAGVFYEQTGYTEKFLNKGGFRKIYRRERNRWLLMDVIPKWLPIVVSIGALIVSLLAFVYTHIYIDAKGK